MSSLILRSLMSSSAAFMLIGCASAQHNEAPTPQSMNVTGTQGTELTATPLETFDSAWAMTFLPDGRALVSEKDGNLCCLMRPARSSEKFQMCPP